MRRPLARLGRAELLDPGPFVSGDLVTLRVRYIAGASGLRGSARLRLGLPNTGWGRPWVPHPRYWDETAKGSDRVYTPFHRINTTVTASGAGARVHAGVSERMLAPDLDPAHGYWRWWVTAHLESGGLEPGESVTFIYGDTRYGEAGAEVQAFPEAQVNVALYVDEAGNGKFRPVLGSPFHLDVVSGPPSRANVVIPSVLDHGSPVVVAVALTDRCEARPDPAAARPPLVLLAGEAARTLPDGLGPFRLAIPTREAAQGIRVQSSDGRLWGKSAPTVGWETHGERLFWGDLHAHSANHSSHSQRANFFQTGWTKSLSTGTPAECYEYARDVAFLDFAAVSDQGACLSEAWESVQETTNAFNESGRFVTFRAYEAGVLQGHRNVYFRSGDVDPREVPGEFSLHPEALYRHYRGRRDVLMIPHHVKVWTDWTFHDPELEPLMEIYSSWGQSEHPGSDLWSKGQTEGAGAWEALRRGYRLGMIASSDTHVGMPGRTFPGSRQWHTPFSGGLCAIWARDLTRESLFDALRARRCYGTSGARIALTFSVGGHEMGSDVRGQSATGPRAVDLRVAGTAALAKVEILRDTEVVHTARPGTARAAVSWLDESTLERPVAYYARIVQEDDARAWTSPVWYTPLARG